MITPTMMYWITRLDGLRSFLHGFDELTAILTVICLVISGVAGIICTVMICNAWEPSEEAEDPNRRYCNYLYGNARRVIFYK